MKIPKILGVIALVAVLLGAGVLLFLSHQLKKGVEERLTNQAAMIKTDDELLGEHFYVPRQDRLRGNLTEMTARNSPRRHCTLCVYNFLIHDLSC